MRIIHPRPELGIVRFLGVDFRDGVAEVDELHPERRLALEQHGFVIEERIEEPEPKRSARTETPKDSEKAKPSSTPPVESATPEHAPQNPEQADGEQPALDEE